MNDFFLGIAACAALTIALFFLRFWRRTRDRLFALFASAFGLLGVQWCLVAVLSPSAETQPYIYILRLFAFVLIIVAIIDKNQGAEKG